MNAFPYTVEKSHIDTDQITEYLEPEFHQSRFFESHEGALLRMFYFKGRWHVSTHRKLNAFRSKWASRESFGTCLKRSLESEVQNNPKLAASVSNGTEGLLERFQVTLDTKKQYMFLVRHTEENRIVNAVPSRPTLYHVGTFVNGELSLDEDINIPHTVEHKFSNIQELCAHVENTDIRHLQGIICFMPNNKQLKIIANEYVKLFHARGNEPSIRFRYLQVRMNKRLSDMLYYLYPEWEQKI